MRQLGRYAARLAAAVLVLAIMIGPIVAVAAVAGNPFPADLFSRVSGRNVDDATIIKLLSLLFYVCWAWFCLPALRQLAPTRRSHARPRSAPGRGATAAAPAVLGPQPKVTGPTHGPRGALARLARFAVSSVAVATAVTGMPGVAHASPGARPAAVVTVVGAPTDSPDVIASAPADDAATTMVAQHRDTPYAIAHRYFAADQVDSAREEILALNVGRPLPDGTTYRGGGFPAGWDVIVPAAASAAVLAPTSPTAEPVVDAGHVVTDGESYWSISEAELTGELGREPTDREVLERTEAAIAYNAPRLGYDDPKMLHTGDIVDVDAATLSATPIAYDAVVEGGHVVADGQSYWSISEAELPGELGREPTDREVYERTEAAIAYNAPRLGYDDPTMLHTGDIVYVDAATLSLTATPPTPVAPAVEPVIEPAVPAAPLAPADEANAPVPLPVPTAAPDDWCRRSAAGRTVDGDPCGADRDRAAARHRDAAGDRGSVRRRSGGHAQFPVAVRWDRGHQPWVGRCVDHREADAAASTPLARPADGARGRHHTNRARARSAARCRDAAPVRRPCTTGVERGVRRRARRPA